MSRLGLGSFRPLSRVNSYDDNTTVNPILDNAAAGGGGGGGGGGGSGGDGFDGAGGGGGRGGDGNRDGLRAPMPSPHSRKMTPMPSPMLR